MCSKNCKCFFLILNVSALFGPIFLKILQIKHGGDFRLGNPFCRRLLRHISACSTSTQPTCVLYNNYTERNLVRVSGKKGHYLTWSEIWTKPVYPRSRWLATSFQRNYQLLIFHSQCLGRPVVCLSGRFQKVYTLGSPPQADNFKWFFIDIEFISDLWNILAEITDRGILRTTFVFC